MEYFAHIDEQNGDRRQSIKDHLEGTAELARHFADSFGSGDWGYCCGMLHDIGKYSGAFQDRLFGISDCKVDHSTAGAQLCNEQGGALNHLRFCIAGHHAGLPDYGGTSDLGNSSSLNGRLKKKIENYQAYKTEIEIPEIYTIPFDSKKSTDVGFSLSVFIRMLFSCLVDADYLDTEQFMKDGKTYRVQGEAIDVLHDKLQRYVSDWLSTTETETINGHRTEILKNCLQQGRQPRGLFRLTVPTGGGKTIASLAFALRHAAINKMDRVIYVIPYTSIIEQNAKVFREILGAENVLENHYNVDYEGNEELRAMHLAAENWDKPVVVTTNVQFFESLFSNKPSKCRKLHNIANSVIIFDEAQMLPNDYLKPCIGIMSELVRNYRSSIVLCTATQPSLKNLFPKDMEIAELCPRVNEQFDFFKRTIYQNIGTIQEETLIERIGREEQALCIVNTRKRAQSLYKQLKTEKGVYHLSTSMYPKHRHRVLEKIREELKAKNRCIVISTSLVEAGVDLDFKAVYRQIAGTDSIIQAAGRCNREGKHKLEESIVSIFQFDETERIPGQSQQIGITKSMINEGLDISKLENIEEYFKRLYNLKGDNLDKKNIMSRFQKIPYFEFATVGKQFRLIEEETKAVFIPDDEEAREILQVLKNQGYTKGTMRKAGQYCVQVYNKVFENLYGAGIIRPITSELEDLYVLTDEERYSEAVGLNLEDVLGIGIFA